MHYLLSRGVGFINLPYKLVWFTKNCLRFEYLEYRVTLQFVRVGLFYDMLEYIMEQIFIIAALILSIVIHEMAHGYAANALGDPTARLAGRLSGNPFVHLDLLGSIIIPAILFITHAGMLFGWAKPVPYNPYNLRNQKWGEAMVAIAGPAINLFLAIVFAGLIRLADVLNLNANFLGLASYIVYINILLACFNLIPLPPLDGSKIIKALLPFKAARQYQEFVYKIESFGIFATFAIVFIFINLLWQPFSQVVGAIFTLMTGLRLF